MAKSSSTPEIVRANRRLVKWKLFRERAEPGYTVPRCELCEKSFATDLHEVYSRHHYPPHLLAEVPEELMSALCNWCNVNYADTIANRHKLMQKNIERYGRERVVAAVEEFSSKMRGLKPYIELLEE